MGAVVGPVGGSLVGTGATFLSVLLLLQWQKLFGVLGLFG